MKGGGFYNSNSELQSSAVKIGVELLQSAQLFDLTRLEQTIRVVDYGCAEGINSIYPFESFIARFSSTKTHPNSPNFQIFFTDRPENDFNSLSQLISQKKWEQNGAVSLVFPNMIGQNFFHQLLPASSVDAGFSFAALHHLRQFPPSASIIGQDEWTRLTLAQARQDLYDFLDLRAREFKSGGCLIISFLSSPSANTQTDPALMAAFRLAMLDIQKEGIIPKTTTSEFSIPAYRRSLDEVQKVLASFEGSWIVDKILEEEVLHPAFEKLQAREEPPSDPERSKYAVTVIEWGLAVLSEYFTRALRRAAAGLIRPDFEKEATTEWAKRATAIFLQQSRLPKVSSCFI